MKEAIGILLVIIVFSTLNGIILGNGITSLIETVIKYNKKKQRLIKEKNLDETPKLWNSIKADTVVCVEE